MSGGIDLDLLHTIWQAARLMAGFPAEDLPLSFGEYLLKHGVVDEFVDEPVSQGQGSELASIAEDLAELRATRRLWREATAASGYDELLHSVAVTEVTGSGAFSVETGANPSTYRPAACAVCGKTLAVKTRGRPAKFCGATCRKRASRNLQ